MKIENADGYAVLGTIDHPSYGNVMIHRRQGMSATPVGGGAFSYEDKSGTYFVYAPSKLLRGRPRNPQSPGRYDAYHEQDMRVMSIQSDREQVAVLDVKVHGFMDCTAEIINA